MLNLCPKVSFYINYIINMWKHSLLWYLGLIALVMSK